MQYVVTPERQSRPGDFGANLAGQRLQVPEDVGRAMRQLAIRSVEDFLAFLGTFPSAVAQVLQWDPPQVEAARGRLVNQLRGHIANEVLSPAEPEARVYGAFNPSDLDR